jgi:hypothetical protein
MGDKPLIHYELREFEGDYDLCQVNGTGMVIRLDATIRNPDILERIAKAFNAQIVREGARGTLPA